MTVDYKDLLGHQGRLAKYQAHLIQSFNKEKRVIAANLEILVFQVPLDPLVHKGAKKVRKENLGSLERGENLAKMVNKASLDIQVIKENKVLLVYRDEMVQEVIKVIEDLLGLHHTVMGRSQASVEQDQRETEASLDTLALKEIEDWQVFRGHLVHQVLQDWEDQVLRVHQVYLEREEKKVMRDSLDSPSLDYLEEQVHQVSKESQDLLVPQEY